MKKHEINEKVGYDFCSDIIFASRTGSGRLPFDRAVFLESIELRKKEFGKFCVLLKKGHLEEAVSFVTDREKFLEINAVRRKRGCAVGGRAAMANPNNLIQNREFTHWSKGTVGKVKAWNKGLTKETDARCLNISEAKKGNKNPMFGRDVSDETRKKLSEKAKHNILTGKWTPNTFNSRTRKQLLFRGKLFRSSWEALFYQAHPSALYEHLRIPYTTDKKHVFITDFVIGTTVFEIKPQKHIELKRDKLDIVRSWCDYNGYTFILLDEFSLTDIIPKEQVVFEEFDPKTEKLLRGLYESVKKRRN